MLLKLDYVRVMLTQERAFFFDADNASVIQFVHRLREGLAKSAPVVGFSFELQVLDAVLAQVTDAYDAEVQELFPVISQLTHQFRGSYKLTDRDYPRLVQLQSRIIELDARLQEVHELLSDEVHWQQTHLPADESGRIVTNYVRQFDENLNDLSKIKKTLKNVFAVSELNTGAKLHATMNLTVYLSIASLVVSVGNLITGIFGMSEANARYAMSHRFIGISVSVTVGAAAVAVLILLIAKMLLEKLS
ncbi:MAG: magnesium transporter CorA family protein [Sulfobacillus sp.]